MRYDDGQLIGTNVLVSFTTVSTSLMIERCDVSNIILRLVVQKLELSGFKFLN